MSGAHRASYVLTADVGHPFYFKVRRLAEEHAVRSVCDFGGGANPVLSLDDIERLGLHYVVVDVSAEELAKTPPGYRTHALNSIADPLDLGEQRFDLVVSRFVAEHMANPAAFHAAVWQALRPGGLAAHFFPTLPSAPFVANRLLMGRGGRLIDLLQPGSRGQSGLLPKFRAYYRWCEGPSRRQYRRLASQGFEVMEYIVFVGHRYYERFPAIQRVADTISRQAIRLRWPAISTYACVVLRRPSP